MQERTLTVGHADLTAALKEWDDEARTQGFQMRRDEARFGDTATYLLDKVERRQRIRQAD